MTSNRAAASHLAPVLALTCCLAAPTRAEGLLEGLKVDLTGSLRGHAAAFGSHVEVQNNASRIGLTAEYRVGLFRPFAQAEWGVDLVQSNTRFNPDGNASSSQALTQAAPGAVPFDTRLGLVGLEVGRFGTLTFGKQYGTTYDVAGWTTDQMFVFGGQGSVVYNLGTDGGFFGTGRAERALAYRVSLFGRLNVGVQTQLRGPDTGREVDSVGASLWYRSNLGLSIGAAYNRAFIDPSSRLAQAVPGLSGKEPQHVIGGLRLARDAFYSAVTVSWSDGHESILTSTGATGVPEYAVLSTLGVEAVARYAFFDKRLTAGLAYNLLKPLAAPAGAPDYLRSLLVLSLAWDFLPGVSAYVEAGLQVGAKDVSGRTPDQAGALGLKVDFSAVQMVRRLLDEKAATAVPPAPAAPPAAPPPSTPEAPKPETPPAAEPAPAT